MSNVPPRGISKKDSMVSLVTVILTVIIFRMKYIVSSKASAKKGSRRIRTLHLSLPEDWTQL
ncbi:MAG: hypothetical protein ABSB83_04490 [Methanomassiliicoccales archaeon]